MVSQPPLPKPTPSEPPEFESDQTVQQHVSPELLAQLRKGRRPARAEVSFDEATCEQRVPDDLLGQLALSRDRTTRPPRRASRRRPGVVLGQTPRRPAAQPPAPQSAPYADTARVGGGWAEVGAFCVAFAAIVLAHWFSGTLPLP